MSHQDHAKNKRLRDTIEWLNLSPAQERRKEERRILRGWRWLKHFLGIDRWIERRQS
jgi:hypothetical protein